MRPADLVIADNLENSRFEAHVEGELAGFIDYRQAGTRRILVHTQVLAKFEGLGIGASLARYALHEARVAGRRVTVRCPFIRAYLLRHPEEADVVSPKVAPRSR
ncbi:MAG: GNAT family N-acetyltransferase [Chloroflexota bacterium]